MRPSVTELYATTETDTEMNIIKYRTSVKLLTVILFVTLIYSCGTSPDEKEARKNSLQSELKQMNDTLTKLKDDLNIANEQLKRTTGFRYISQEAVADEIKTQSNKIDSIQKKITLLETRIETKHYSKQ